LLGGSQVSNPDGDGARQGISRGGQFLSKLQSLKQSDPAKFKNLLTQISNQLSAAAQQAGTGTTQGQFLSDLAARFQNVANGGDLSQLQAPRSAGNRLQQAYGQGEQSSQQILYNALNNQTNGQLSATDAAIRKLMQSIAEQVSQATESTSAGAR
jgi:hypothetical protein